MANPFFSGRIPQELLDHVEQHRESTGETKTDVLVKALAAYTGFQLDEKVESVSSTSTIADLLARIEKLENRVFETKPKPEISEAEKRQIDLFSISTEKKNADEEKHKSTEISQDNTEILMTDEVIEKEIVKSKSTLSNWKRKNQLPKIHNGFLIDKSTKEEKAERNAEKDGKAQDCWRVTPV